MIEFLIVFTYAQAPVHTHTHTKHYIYSHNHICTHLLSLILPINLPSLSFLSGYLQLVSAYSFATTVNSATSFASSPVSLLQTYYSNTVYLTPTALGKAKYSTYAGALDCGTNAAGTYTY